MMELHTTSILEETSKWPTELDQLQITTARDFLSTENDRFKLQILKAGLAGEDKAVKCLENHGKDHWIMLRNLWINFNNAFEYDIILITNHCVYIFEVKNYTGNFTYENGVCILNNRKMDHDVIQQTRRNFLRMERLCNQLPNPPKVKGAIIFIGENNQVEIKSPVEDIETLQLTDFYEYIKDMIEAEENTNHSTFINPTQIITHLEKFEVAHPYPPQSLSKSVIQEFRPGIHCARCGNYNLKTTKYYLECPCGYHESREEAIVRTVCDYGVLTHDKNFSLGEIMAFINHEAAHTFLRDILVKHFKQTLNGRFTYYENKKLPYYKISHEFEFERPAIFYTKRAPQHIIVYN